MKTTGKRKTNKSGRKTGRTTTARFLQDNAGTALRRGRETISRAYDWVHEAAEGARLRKLHLPRRADIRHLTEANPLLLGAVGLGLGVAIGTLFPLGTHRTASGARRAVAARTAPVRSRRRRRRKNGAAARKTAAKKNAATATA